MPDNQVDLRATLLTPPGRGGIAVIALEGVLSVATVNAFFTPASGKAFDPQPSDRLWFGHWLLPTGAKEEVVLRMVDSNRAELYCHGGPSVTRMILTELEAAGATVVSWQQRLEDSDEPALSKAALRELAACRSERTAFILLDQYEGALERELCRICESIQAGNTNDSLTAVETLLGRSSAGLHLTQPWTVVLAGRPNVGKSSLINALLGYERAIVYEQPGTTRDVLAADAALEGWPVELLDTAGMRSSVDPLESAGVRQAQDLLAAADLIVLVLDATAGISGEEHTWQQAHASAMTVVNKCDLVEPNLPEDYLRVSAKTGAGLPRLVESIVAMLVPEPPPAGSAVPFTPAQVDRLKRARHALQTDRPLEAVRVLTDLLTLTDHR